MVKDYRRLGATKERRQAEQAVVMRLLSTERVVGPSAPPLYLTPLDVILRYTWVGLCLGFRHSIDKGRLKQALDELLQAYPCLSGR